VENTDLVGRLTVASASPWMANYLRGMFRSREPFKFWWAPTISLERLIVSGAVNLGGQSVWSTGDVISHSLSHWPSTSVYGTVGARHCVAQVCQQHRRLV